MCMCVMCMCVVCMCVVYMCVVYECVVYMCGVLSRIADPLPHLWVGGVHVCSGLCGVLVCGVVV